MTLYREFREYYPRAVELIATTLFDQENNADAVQRVIDEGPLPLPDSTMKVLGERGHLAVLVYALLDVTAAAVRLHAEDVAAAIRQHRQFVETILARAREGQPVVEGLDEYLESVDRSLVSWTPEAVMARVAQRVRPSEAA